MPLNRLDTAMKQRAWTRAASALLVLSALAASADRALAQSAAQAGGATVIETSPATQAKLDTLIDEILLPETELDLDPEQSKLIRTKQPVARFSVTDPGVVEIVQFSPTEFELIGGAEGRTTMTMWFTTPEGRIEVLRYLVRVTRRREVEDRRRAEYGELQKMINEMFPNSMVQLIPIADKLIVRGQARDSEEGTQIMSVLRGQATDQGGYLFGPGIYGGLIAQGTAAVPFPGASDLPASGIINMLDVPGEQQVMLRVRVAEMTRSALREMGADFSFQAGDFNFGSSLSVGGAFQAVLNSADVQFTLSALSSNGSAKILAEPNLVTISGRPASFIAGGEFAVPVVVGVGGAAAATTNFRGFGTQLTFTPTVMDKDRIRLQVAPSFSTINSDVTVNGIPGLNSRAVFTTVDLREGQWLAIAGLIQDQQSGSKARVPFLGDIPLVDTMFSRRSVKREETELIILVSPELVHPMEAEQVPLVLPGMEMTEPGDIAFFLFGRYEGDPNCHHRSTVWPIQRDRIIDAKHRALHEAKMQAHYQRCEQHYFHGPHGFSD